MTYAEWRRQLHELQLEIDKYDEEFDWEIEGPAVPQWKEGRSPLIDKLEAHYKLESTCV